MPACCVPLQQLHDYEGGKEGEKGGAKGGKGEKGGGGLHVECFGVKRIVRRSTIPRGYCSTT